MTPALNEFSSSPVFPFGRTLPGRRVSSRSRFYRAGTSVWLQSAGCISELSIPACPELPVSEWCGADLPGEVATGITCVTGLAVMAAGSPVGCISADLILEEEIFQDMSIALPAGLQ